MCFQTSNELDEVYRQVAAKRINDSFWGVGVAVPTYPVKNDNVKERDAMVARFAAYNDPLRHDCQGLVSPAAASTYRKGMKCWTFSAKQYDTQELLGYVEL